MFYNPLNLQLIHLSIRAIQGIIDSTGKETRQIFSRMFVTAKSFEELFTPT